MTKKKSKPQTADAQRYRWYWRKRLADRHGEEFVVICRGHSMNSCLIEFARDGFRVVTSRNALRKV